MLSVVEQRAKSLVRKKTSLLVSMGFVFTTQYLLLQLSAA